ncbi:YtxH domain-containing protein [Pedobacter sp. N36a]|uniref:YtxH domain-containing protein n=1 Tax=Pedobacter sp. N36a TaxID=2767996 RepID=UPI001656EF67|nr:YtxH domain-containing protein [Pedobacter sp. N36a]MBC8985217.1 YtxH domain-containing protein [Pedobacter sp. N36a]
MNQDTKIILGIFAGLAAGAALGLLLAPEEKTGHLNGHAAASENANGGSISDELNEKQIQHLDRIKDRLMNTFEKDDFNDHVEHV